MDSISTVDSTETSPGLTLSGELPEGKKVEDGFSFKKLMQNFFSNVNESQLQADQAMQAFAMGDTQNAHSTMLAVEKATLMLQFANALQSKLIAAYQEINRTAV